MSTVTPSRPVAGNALTMPDLGRRYLAHLVRRGRKKATTTSVESILRIWLNTFFAERDVRTITAEDVRDLMGMMESGHRPGPKLKGDRRYGKPAGAKTVRNYIGTLSALLNFAERNGWLPANVAKHVDLPGSPRNEDIRFLELGGARPYLFLHVTGVGGQARMIPGLIDSGADSSVLPAGYAPLLGYGRADLDRVEGSQVSGSVTLLHATRPSTAHVPEFGLRVRGCSPQWLGSSDAMPKDRTRQLFVALDVLIVIERSNAHPVEYAIMLLVERDGVWHTVRTFDNAHSPEEHHEHRYVGVEKQEPIVTQGSVNDAMHGAEVKLIGGWGDIVRSWERTR